MRDSLLRQFGAVDEFESRMKAYLENNRQGKHGRHKYDNAEYGIDTRRLYESNRACYERYGFQADPGSTD